MPNFDRQCRQQCLCGNAVIPCSLIVVSFYSRYKQLDFALKLFACDRHQHLRRGTPRGCPLCLPGVRACPCQSVPGPCSSHQMQKGPYRPLQRYGPNQNPGSYPAMPPTLSPHQILPVYNQNRRSATNHPEMSQICDIGICQHKKNHARRRALHRLATHI